MKRTAIFDTETTGLIKPSINDITRQPYITEICMIIIDEEGKKVDALVTHIKPPVPIDEASDACRITGIVNDTVKNSPSFAEVYPRLCEMMIGTERLVAHNLSFDRSMLANELLRIDRVLRFPWPPTHICTVESTLHINGYRLKLAELYKMATGKNIEGAHRALADTEALVEAYKWCLRQGYIK